MPYKLSYQSHMRAVLSGLGPLSVYSGRDTYPGCQRLFMRGFRGFRVNRVFKVTRERFSRGFASQDNKARPRSFFAARVFGSLRKQPPFFASGTGNATRAGSEEGRLFSQASGVSSAEQREKNLWCPGYVILG